MSAVLHFNVFSCLHLQLVFTQKYTVCLSAPNRPTAVYMFSCGSFRRGGVNDVTYDDADAWEG